MSDIQASIMSFLRERNTRRHLTVIVCMIAAATVLAVFWSLHIKGITLSSGDLVCGMEEHTHTVDCYAWVPVVDETEDGSELEEIESVSETGEISATETVSETEESTVTETASVTKGNTEAESNSGTEAADEIAASSAESSSETTTESATESVSAETGTEALTEDETETLTEEETEVVQVGDTKIINGVEYVYTLICGMEEHTHTDECYADDEDSEETETEESANVSSLTAGVSSLGVTRLGSSDPSVGVSAASVEEEDNSAIATIAEEGSEENSEEENNGYTVSLTASAEPSYYYVDGITLADAANSQEGTYIIYTEIAGTYYVTAYDGSLVECIDATAYTSVDDDTEEGIYYMGIDGTSGNAVFKCTTYLSAFDNYVWTLTGTVADTDTGEGSYTLYNTANKTYLAPEEQIDASEPSVANGTLSSGDYPDTIEMDGNGTVVYSFYLSGPRNNSFNFGVDISDDSGNEIIANVNYNTYYDTTTPANIYVSGTTNSSLSLGNLSLSRYITCTVTVIRSGDNFYINFYNESTGSYYTYVVDVSGFDSTVYYNVYIYNGTYTISAVTAGISSTDTSSETSSYSGGELTKIDSSSKTLSGDFDVTYTFDEISGYTTSLAYDYWENFVLEITDGSYYIDARANNDGWTFYQSVGAFDNSTGIYTDSTWQSLMKAGASCTVRIIRTGDNFCFITTVSGNVKGTPVSYTYMNSVTMSDIADEVTMYLMCNCCTISNISYVNNTARSYNATYSRVSTSEKYISMTADSGLNYWTATALGSYGETFQLIGQVADDGSVAIEWVEDPTATSTRGSTTTLTSTTSNITTQFYLAEMRGYYAWFDGTNGGIVTLKNANNTTDYYDEKLVTSSNKDGTVFTVTAPEASEVTDDSYYSNYKLRGWYDIYNAAYYEPGDVIELSGNTVLYADWKVEDYAIGENTDLADAVSTSSFITTNLFDYNELFNLAGVALADTSADKKTTSDNVTYTETISRTLTGTSHREVFVNNAGSVLDASSRRSIIFFRTETTSLYFSGLGKSVNGIYNPLIDFPDYRQTYNASQDGTTQGILGNYGTLASSNELLNILFGLGNTVDDLDANSSSVIYGKTYVGTGDYLFQYDANSGYYYYDSARNAAAYNSTDNRFYVYDYTVRVVTSNDTSENDFLPYNYASKSNASSGIQTNNINYWFGMSTTIEFYLSDNVPDETPTGAATANLASVVSASEKDKDHMTFKFSGDDDVWVFIDDQLVLDLGGVHGQVYGEIDFSTGEVVVVNSTDDGNGRDYVTYDRRYIIDYTEYAEDDGEVIEQNTAGNSAEKIVRSLTEGTHTLTFYYLERGATESNAAVYFNISSETYNLELTKWAEELGTALEGATFSYYTSSDFDDDSLVTLEDAYGNEKTVFEAGKVAKGLRVGRTYYVKEVTTPEGYSNNGRYLEIYLSRSGVLTINVYATGSNTILETYTYTIDSTYVTGTWEAVTTNTTGWSYVYDATGQTGSLTDDVYMKYTPVTNGVAGYYDIGIIIQNTKEYEIPSAGDTGITKYLFTGKIMVLLAEFGLVITAFYHFVWKRRLRAIAYKKDDTEEKIKREKQFTRMRGHPRERSITRGHPRDRPRNRTVSSADGSTERSRGTGPGKT